MYDKVDNLNTKNQKIKAIKSQINMYKDKDILNVSQADKDLLIFSKKRTYTSNLTTVVKSVLKFMINGTTSILKSYIFQICAAIYQLPLHMVFTSRN